MLEVASSLQGLVLVALDLLPRDFFDVAGLVSAGGSLSMKVMRRPR